VLIFGRQAQFRIHFSSIEPSIQWGKHRFYRDDGSMVASNLAGQRVYEVIQLLLLLCFSLCDVLGGKEDVLLQIRNVCLCYCISINCSIFL
jgi:hypothetical protein